MGLKNLPPIHNKKKGNIIEMNNEKSTVQSVIKDLEEGKKVNSILELKEYNSKEDLIGESTPSTQKEDNDNFSNVSNDGSQRSSDIQNIEKIDILSEPDIEKENSSFIILSSYLKKLDFLIKKRNGKIQKNYKEIKWKIEELLKNIKIINYIDTEDKKSINTIISNLNRIEEESRTKKIDKNEPTENFEEYYNNILVCYSEFMEKNRETLDRIKKDKLRMKIPHEKDFNKHLEKKLEFLSERLDLLQMKYNGYKKWYDRMNIAIIIISTVLSVFESFRLEIQDLIPKNAHGLQITFNMIPIVISSGITCSAAIIKFKKYQEKMENMQFTREKVITSISRIENVKESLWFNEDKEFKNIKDNYIKEVFTTYNESISELKRHIKFDDPQKFTKHVTEKKENKNIYIY